MTKDVLQNIEEIRQAHKALHGNNRIQKQALIERLEDGRTVEETINKGNGKGKKYVFYKTYAKGPTTKK